MQRIISFLGKNLLVFGLISLMSLSGVSIFAAQPGYAAPSSAQERLSDSSKVDQLEQNYDQIAKDAKDVIGNPQALNEEYDRDKKVYKQEQGEQGKLVEGAKKIFGKATNTDK